MDYDGTLAEFAPSPDFLEPDPALLDLLRRLLENNKYLPTLLSGRSLQHLHALVPLPGLMLAGTYGIEIELPDGTQINTLDYQQVRPMMEQLLPHWQALLTGQSGFFLEDKGWSLAMHARFATPEDARRVLGAARAEIDRLAAGPDFAVEHRERFLEFAPAEASKRRSVQTILARYTPAGAMPLYVGDDLNDEAAFEAVQAAGGICVRVSEDHVQTRAQYRLAGPYQVRRLLAAFAAEGLPPD